MRVLRRKARKSTARTMNGFAPAKFRLLVVMMATSWADFVAKSNADGLVWLDTGAECCVVCHDFYLPSRLV